MRNAVLVVLLLLLAGCSGGGGKPTSATTTDDAFKDIGAKATATTGVVLGLVVDERIVPIPLADVRLSGGGVNLTKKSDEEGRFAFDGLAPGMYFVAAHALLHTDAQSSVQVVAGVEQPPATKLLLTRMFTQDPYHETIKFEGFIQCGYSVSGAISSICFQDYTHFVGPTTCPQCEHVFDNRGTIIAVNAGWQTQVYEMTWDPSAQGTSPEMGLTVSFYPRVASHWYCQGGGPDPVLVRMEVGVTCDNSQDDPQPFPPEGLNNTYFFASSRAPDGQPASATLSQKFTVIVSIFYYGKPPEGWSFMGGDGTYPF